MSTRAFRALATLLLTLLAFDVDARRIDPGEAPKLKPDEGLVVLDVEAPSPIDSVSVSQNGGVLGGILIPQLKPGRTVQLHAVKAGDYGWHEVTMFQGWSGIRYQLHKNPEMRFHVDAGKLSYPGELVIRGTSLYRVGFHRANRSLPIIDWLESKHPDVARAFPLQYVGPSPDPFPEWYAKERAAVPAVADLNSGAPVPAAGTLPIDPKVLWGRAKVVAVALSPGGQLLAEATYKGKDVWQLELIDLKSGDSQVLTTSALEYDSLTWKDESTLISAASLGTLARKTLYLFGPGPGKRVVRSGDFPQSARVVDTLPGQPGRILVERYDSAGKLVVHAVDVSGVEALSDMQHLKSKDRLNTALTDDVAWYADGSGDLRAAVVRRNDAYVLMHGRGATFQQVLAFDDDDSFQPQMLSYDGETLYGLTDEGRGQRDVVAFDLREKKITRTVFSKPDVDIESIVYDDRREPVGARYYQSGQLVTEYFGAADRARASTFGASFPGSTVSVIDRSSDGKQLILWVERSDRTPQLYHLDVDARRASLLDEMIPALADFRFAPMQVVKARSKDGLPIEAFLTLPAGSGPVPLVLMPHGGPIGVADRVQFDREVQFIASLGYAVLQVNFRGSDGYGRAFREAGRRGFGTRIEDDLDSALQLVLANHPIDPKRMCVLGGSYGGYSALISTVRWPDRFRCAVSMAGVTDLPLLFTASDSAATAAQRKDLVTRLGDPAVEMDSLLSLSPVYRYRDLKTPLLLVHGRDDLRVDFEHARRLVRMLNLAGSRPIVMAFQDEGHGLNDIGDNDTAWRGIAGFLKQHLGQGRPIPNAAAPAASAAAR